MFQSYLGGHPFTLLPYHKPLTTIFHPHKGILATASARTQRWALFRSGFSYQIVVPQKLQQHVLDELHEGHDGIVKMK